MVYSLCDHLLLAFTSTSQHPAAVWHLLCAVCHVLYWTNGYGLNTLDLYRNISPEAEIKSLLESGLSGPSRRSHSVFLQDLMGKLGKVMRREQLKYTVQPSRDIRIAFWEPLAFIKCFILSYGSMTSWHVMFCPTVQNSKIFGSLSCLTKKNIIIFEKTETVVASVAEWFSVDHTLSNLNSHVYFQSNK